MALELELKNLGSVPTDNTKTNRVYGVKENGEEIYLGRHENFVALVIKEENIIEKDNN